MEKFDPYKLSPAENVRLSMLYSKDKDSKLQEIEKRISLLEEIKDEKKRLKRTQEILNEIDAQMDAMEQEWDLFWQETDSGIFYDYNGNEIEDFEEFTKGKTDRHYKAYFKHYHNYLFARSEVKEALDKLKFIVGDQEDEPSDQEGINIEKIFPNIKARHQFLLLYELGIIEHLKEELSERGISETQQNDLYIAKLLAHIMNTELSPETIRKDRAYLTHPNPTPKQNPKTGPAMQKVESILEKFNLTKKRL